MSDKKLALLGIIAAGSVIWAVVQTRISNKPRIATDKPAYLIWGLETRDIDSITIGTGDDEVTLKRQAGGQFVVTNKDNYPAEMKQINDLITKCLDIQTTQFITEKKENHETLGVTEAKARNVVKFFKSDGSLLTGIIVGNARQTGQSSYVRLATDDKVYVAQNVPWLGSGSMSYIKAELITVARDNIESVTVVSPDGQYTLKRKTEGEGIMLEYIPAGMKLKDSDSKSVFNAATDMRFTDVKKQSAETNELNFDRQYICKLKDSTVYTIKIARKDGKTFVLCEAEFTDTTPVTIKKEGESEEELKKKEAKLLARDKAKKFTAEHQGWIYEIADWKAQNLTKELSVLLEDEPKPAEQQTEQKIEEKQPDETESESATGRAEAEEVVEADEFDAADIEL
jgi:hypothetical protein